MRDSIDQFTQRTQRYWYVDGLVEMAGGAIMLMTGLFYLVIPLIDNTPLRSLLLAFGMPALIIAGMFGARKIITSFKNRITYPRTGYVTYKRPRTGRRALSFMVAAVFTAILILVIALTRDFISDKWLEVISATLVALFTLYLAYQFGLKRFYAISLITFALGLMTAWLAMPGDLSSAFFFSTLGLVWILSGSWTLAQYLRKTSPPVEEQL